MNPLPSLPCYLNGEFTELPDAKVNVMDSGFIFCDGVYEVVPVYGGRPFRFEQHMTRLNRSLAEVRIADPMTQTQWAEVALKLVKSYAAFTGAQGRKHQAVDQYSDHPRRGHARPRHAPDITPTVFVMANKMNSPTDAQRSQGVACVTADDFLWEKTHIKSTSLLGSVLSREIK